MCRFIHSLKPIKPSSALLVTSHCALHRKDSLRVLVCRVTCTWWLLGLALKRPWLVPGGPPPALTAWTGLKHHVEGWFLARKAAWALSRCMATDSADYYMLINEWAWSKSRDCLLRLKADMGSVLESELGQKWR